MVNVRNLPAVTSPLSGMSNLSIRGSCGGNEGPLTVCFASSGSSPLPILVRTIGPGIALFSVKNVLDDTVLTLFEGIDEVCFNEAWVGSVIRAIVESLFTRVGAFSLSDASSHDDAMGIAVSGPHTVQIKSATTNAKGVVLVEVYD